MSDAPTRVLPAHRAVVETYFGALLRADVRECLATLCHPQVQFHEVMGDFVGLVGFDSELLARPRTLIPGLTIDLQELIGDATECAARWQLHGTYPAAERPGGTKGNDGGAPGSPSELRTEGTTWFRFEGALIAEVWTYWDGATLFSALGGSQDAA